MVAWTKLSKQQKQAIITNVANSKGISEQVVEKDIWVTLVLEALFSLPDIGSHLVFKGGTSLSKGYDLIERFSEDIDFAIDRKFLGFEGELTPADVRKLRRASAAFIKDKLTPQLSARLLEMGVSEEQFKVVSSSNGSSDEDPLPVHIEFTAVAGASGYLADKVILEIGARSMMEPAENRQIRSLISDVYTKGEEFAGKPFDVPTVIPTRTFLEKIFLLHEQFQLATQTPPRNRMSRHLYDVEKLMSTTYADDALKNKELYEHIVAHRQALTPIKGISYESHSPATINILPPEAVMELWGKDYGEFIDNMVVGKKLNFVELIARIKELQERIQAVNW